jgi:hypothetical protein
MFAVASGSLAWVIMRWGMGGFHIIGVEIGRSPQSIQEAIIPLFHQSHPVQSPPELGDLGGHPLSKRLINLVEVQSHLTSENHLRH